MIRVIDGVMEALYVFWEVSCTDGDRDIGTTQWLAYVTVCHSKSQSGIKVRES